MKTTKQLLQEWKDYHDVLDKTTEELNKLFGKFNESPLIDNMWLGFELYTESLSLLMKDDDDWIAWFWLENEMGKNKLRAKVKEQETIVSNIDDLIKLLEQSI
jgi:hypothetical protein